MKDENVVLDKNLIGNRDPDPEADVRTAKEKLDDLTKAIKAIPSMKPARKVKKRGHGYTKNTNRKRVKRPW